MDVCKNDFKSLDDICNVINSYLGINAASKSMKLGLEVISIDIESVINVALSQDTINKMMSTDETKIIEILLNEFTILKFFDKKDVLVKKEEVEIKAIFNSLDEEKIEREIQKEPNLRHGITLLNKQFNKDYIVNSKRGILFNIGIYVNNPLPNSYADEIANIKSFNDAKELADKLCSLMSGLIGYRKGNTDSIYLLNKQFKSDCFILSKRGIVLNLHLYGNKALPSHLADEVNNISSENQARKVADILCEEINSLIKYRRIYDGKSISDNDEYIGTGSGILSSDAEGKIKVYGDTLIKINSMLTTPLKYNAESRLMYEEEVRKTKGKKKKKKIIMQKSEKVFPLLIQNKFEKIKNEEDINVFLILLEGIKGDLLKRKTKRFIDGKWYISNKERYLSFDKLEQYIMAINEQFITSMVYIAEDGLRISSKYLSDEVISRFYDVHISNTDYSNKVEKMTLILKGFVNIPQSKYKFIGSKDMLSKTEIILVETIDRVKEYLSMLENLNLKKVEELITVKHFFGLHDIEHVIKLKEKVLDEQLCIDKRYYYNIVDIKHPLFKLTIEENKDDLSIKETIDIFTDKCILIKRVSELINSGALDIIKRVKSSIKKIAKENIETIIEELEAVNKYDERDIKIIKKECKEYNFFTQKKVFMCDEGISIFGLKRSLDCSKDEIDSIIESHIKNEYIRIRNERTKLLDELLAAGEDAAKFLRIDLYAAIVYLVDDIKSKGITTYRDILAGACTSSKNRQEFSSHKIYGYLSKYKKVEIEDYIETLIDKRLLARVNKRASFGNYDAIITGQMFKGDMLDWFRAKLSGKPYEHQVNSSVSGEHSDYNSDIAKVSNEISAEVAIELNKSKKDINLTEFLLEARYSDKLSRELEKYNIIDVKLSEAKKLCDFMSDNKRFIKANWSAISVAVPKMDNNIITFFKLRNNITNNNIFKYVYEIEENKDVL